MLIYCSVFYPEITLSMSGLDLVDCPPHNIEHDIMHYTKFYDALYCPDFHPELFNSSSSLATTANFIFWWVDQDSENPYFEIPQIDSNSLFYTAMVTNYDSVELLGLFQTGLRLAPLEDSYSALKCNC